jgi:PAS domain S-box-containing protein
MNEAEQTLRDTGERFRVVIDNALDAVVAMDSAGLITVWNRQAEAVFGWSREEALGRELHELIVPERFREAHERGVAAFSSGGRGALVGRRIETRAVRRSGEEFPVELAITEAPEGQGAQFTAFLRDITEKRGRAPPSTRGQRLHPRPRGHHHHGSRGKDPGCERHLYRDHRLQA